MDERLQMSIVPDFLDITAGIPRSVDLFMSGLYWISTFPINKAIRFSQWARLIRKARPDEAIDHEKLKWLWEAVTTDPAIKKTVGNRIVSLEEEWKKIPPVECLPKGTRFGIFLKGLRSAANPEGTLNGRPDAIASILEPLCLKPGRAKRLECCDVATSLELRPEDLGTLLQEAALLNVDENRIVIQENQLIVGLKSLNHAYTKVSLRLEPHRRIPGGKIYEHVAYFDGGQFVPLEKVRAEKEKILWEQLIA